MRNTNTRTLGFLFIGALLAISPARANVFDTLESCIDHGDHWDAIWQKCIKHDPGKPFPETELKANCVWKQQSFELDATRHIAMAFRYQVCGTEKLSYLFDQQTGMLFKNEIKPGNAVAEFFDYAPGSLKAIIEQKNAKTLQPDEELDCEVVYINEVRGYAYLPNKPYANDLMYRERPYQVCGDHGFNTEKRQFFRVLKDKILIFFRLEPAGERLDAQSFRLQ